MQVEQNCDEHFAVCRQGTQKHVVDISLVGKQPKGAWLLVFLGAAREVVPKHKVDQFLHHLDSRNDATFECGNITSQMNLCMCSASVEEVS